MTEAVVLVPLFPLLAVIANLVFRRRLSRSAVGILACGSVASAFLASVVAISGLTGMEAGSRVFNINLFQWIGSGDFSVPIGFLLDPLSSVMILVITGVGFLIHVYSIGYMEHDEGVARYFLYLNLFVFAMLMLVLGNSFLVMFVGWEGVGLCSYLLIGFWYKKESASSAGRKAFIVNRVGDFGFMLGMLLIAIRFGSLSYGEVFGRAHQVFNQGDPMIILITLLLFLGATGKSAQLPLHIWLPDAMEGPTPVSALIHAATMVTAGVYMVCRSHVLFEMAPPTMMLIASIGALTAFFAATIALVQNDIKRVLAYSTISQLGYMFLAVGVGAYTTAIFHLMTHAFFKALLFMCAGSVMHGLAGELDIRKMGGLRKIMPTTFKTFVVASLAISGIPPLAGFMSKDEILNAAFNSKYGGGFLLWFVGVVTAFMTAFYMFRLVYRVFYGESRLDPEVAKHAHESPSVMTVPLVILAFLSTVGGFAGFPIIEKWHLLHNWLGPVFNAVAEHGGKMAETVQSIGLELGLMGISVVVAVGGIWLALVIILRRPQIAEEIRKDYSFLYDLFFHKWWVDELYGMLIVRPLNRLGSLLWTGFDGGVIDGTLHGIANSANWSGGLLARLQTGLVQNYALAMTVGLVLVLFWTFFV